MGFARNFWKASPVGWLAALPWPFITEACRALWCRWWHCKRSIDVGDGNYPAALLHKIDPWTFCLPSCCCKKRVFFFSVCWCVDSFKIYFAIASSYWRFIIYHLGGWDSCIFFANSTTLRTVLASIFLIFTRIPGEMLKIWLTVFKRVETTI